MLGVCSLLESILVQLEILRNEQHMMSKVIHNPTDKLIIMMVLYSVCLRVGAVDKGGTGSYRQTDREKFLIKSSSSTLEGRIKTGVKSNGPFLYYAFQ